MLHFDLPEQMVVIIGRALEQMPYGTVVNVIAELQKQIDAQQRKNGKSVSLSDDLPHLSK